MLADTQGADIIDLAAKPQVELKIPAQGALHVQYVKAEPTSTQKLAPTPDGLPPEIRTALTQLQAMSRTELRKWMQRHFSLEELRNVIDDDLEIDSSTFNMETVSNTIRGIIGYCDRHGRFPKLLEYLARERVDAILLET